MGCAQSKQASDEPRVTVAPQLDDKQTAAVATSGGQAAKVSRESPTSPLDADDSSDGDCCFKPESETDRLQALLNCKCLDTVDERRFDAITALLKDMFNVPMALVSLIDNDQLVFKSVAGTDCRQGNRLHSFCDASLRAPNPTMMVVPDTLEDARFCNSQFVAGEPHVRFYSGAPLVSSDGHVLGSLGIMDVKPRTFPAGSLNIICNFAELVVREMERDKAREAKQASAAAANATDAAAKRTVRALSAFDEAVLLCNAADDKWQVMYVNQEWCAAMGQSESQCLTSGLWSLLKPAHGSANKDSANAAVSQRKGFELKVEAPGGGGVYRVELHPATRDHLSLAAPAIAIPNFVEGLAPEELKALDGLYFAVVRRPGAPEPMGAATPLTSQDHKGARVNSAMSNDPDTVINSALSVSSISSTASFGLECPDELNGLVLGPMLGRGGMGKVYRGTWQAQGVAVKIVDILGQGSADSTTGPIMEALLSKRLSHPNIVATHDFAVKALEMQYDGEDPLVEELAAPEAAAQQQLWIIQQYCEHGTLGDALDRGWLRHARTPTSGPNMVSVLSTAKEVATAMAYLHSKSVLHGDLTPGNVLLSATEGAAPARGGATGVARDPRNFSAMVGDFGLSRVLDEKKKQIQTGTFGTVSHMPMELIEGQLLSKATDVFSFGVLLWEMYAGKRAWAGKSAVQILYARTAKRQRLRVPADWPTGYTALIESCLQDDHALRPSFEEVVVALSALLDDE